MKKTLFSVFVSVLVLALSSCGGKTMTDDFIGKWEITSKDDVDEDGVSIELILELKADNVFTQTQTLYENGEKMIVITIDGEYGLTKVYGNDIKKYNSPKEYCLWRKYDLESLQVYCDDEEYKEIYKDDAIQRYREYNKDLENAEKGEYTFGLQNVRVIKGSELSWDTDEELKPGFAKRDRAKYIL